MVVGACVHLVRHGVALRDVAQRDSGPAAVVAGLRLLSRQALLTQRDERTFPSPLPPPFPPPLPSCLSPSLSTHPVA